MTSAVVRAVVRTAAHGVVQVAPSSGVEHIQNGNFDDGDTGWTVGSDWAIALGQADGEPGTEELVNTLNVAVQSSADISSFRGFLINPSNTQVRIALRSDVGDSVIYSGNEDGLILPTVTDAGTRGPYHSLVIVNDGGDNFSVDYVTLVY